MIFIGDGRALCPWQKKNKEIDVEKKHLRSVALHG